jgi:hypothetical protein
MQFFNPGVSAGTGNADIVTLLSASQMNVNETYFALLEFDYSTTGADAVTATIFDGAATPVAMQTFSGLNLDGNLGYFHLATANYDDIVVTDEWRFGTTLSDVMTPEPATWAMWSMIGLIVTTFIGVQRRRTKTST